MRPHESRVSCGARARGRTRMKCGARQYVGAQMEFCQDRAASQAHLSWRCPRWPRTDEHACLFAERVGPKGSFDALKEAFAIRSVHIQNRAAVSDLVAVVLAEALRIDDALQLGLDGREVVLFGLRAHCCTVQMHNDRVLRNTRLAPRRGRSPSSEPIDPFRLRQHSGGSDDTQNPLVIDLPEHVEDSEGGKKEENVDPAG